MIGREREKKEFLVPNSVQTRPGQKTSEKNSKKIQKIKKPLSGIIFTQNGMRLAEKERKKKNLVPNSVHTRPGQENSETNRKRNQIMEKPLFGIIFCQNGM